MDIEAKTSKYTCGCKCGCVTISDSSPVINVVLSLPYLVKIFTEVKTDFHKYTTDFIYFNKRLP